MTLNEIRNHVPEQVEKDHSKHPFGEYGMNGKHMYHESEPPMVVYNAADEKAARKKGYDTDYVPMAYPKAMHKGSVMATAANAAQEKELAAKGWR